MVTKGAQSIPAKEPPTMDAGPGDLNLDDIPEDYDELPRTLVQKDVVRFVEKPQRTAKGKKHAHLVMVEEPCNVISSVDSEEEFEVCEDSDAAKEVVEVLDFELEDREVAEYDDEDHMEINTGDVEINADDVEINLDAGDLDMELVVTLENDGQTSDSITGRATRLTSSMSVDISNHDSKRIKLKDMESAPLSMRANLKKDKLKNSHLPPGTHDDRKWHLVFLPSLIYWAGNSKYAWSIPDETLRSVLQDIYLAIYNRNGCFEDDSFGYHMATQRLHEWWAAFGSTTISILMAFFASMPQYNTQEARTEYADYQLHDSHFIYEDADNDDQLVRVDSFNEFGAPGYQTALALTAAAAERALTLVRDGLLITNDAEDSKKSHKIVPTHNEATNRMSNTGTQFSSGNWEADTMAYMKSVEELPYSRIQEIILHAEPFMRRPHHKVHTSSEASGSDAPIAPANPHSRIRI
ncbi:hypothetical protein AZE42_11019, partial [Rhizopogon vesiculosus]